MHIPRILRCSTTHLVHGSEPRLAAGGVLGIDRADASHVGGEHLGAVLERDLARVRLLELDLVVTERVRLIICEKYDERDRTGPLHLNFLSLLLSYVA